MRYLSFQILFLVATMVTAQSLIVPLYDGKIPNSKPSDEKERVDTSNIIRVSKVQDPQIEVFLGAPKNANGQAVLICPGGGYGILAYDWEGYDIAKWLNSKGIAGIVLKYRLPSDASQVKKELSPLMDAQRAMRIIRANAKKWNIDPQKIGVMGFSAGGHLASTLGTHFDLGNPMADDTINQVSCRPDFMILGYPVISMDSDVTHAGSKRNLLGENPSKELETYYSNEKQVKEDTPPTFIFHSEDDNVVPIENSIRMYQELRDKKIPAEAHFFPTGGHGYSLGLNTNETYSNWPIYCETWLKNINKKGQ